MLCGVTARAQPERNYAPPLRVPCKAKAIGIYARRAEPVLLAQLALIRKQSRPFRSKAEHSRVDAERDANPSTRTR